MEESGRKYTIKTLQEALKILRGMSESADPINQAEAARIANVSANTAYRMLETLCEAEFVEKIEGGYVVGPMVGKLWKTFRVDQKRRLENAKKNLRETYIPGEEPDENGNGTGENRE